MSRNPAAGSEASYPESKAIKAGAWPIPKAVIKWSHRNGVASVWLLDCWEWNGDWYSEGGGGKEEKLVEWRGQGG